MAISLSEFLPFLGMVVVQWGYAGTNIISKLALDDGFSPFVFVTYRQIVATLSLAPFVIFLERKVIPTITLPILFQVFLCSITGSFMTQGFFLVGLQHSTPTIAGALVNLLPALTFIFAVIFRQENVGIKRKSGVAKVFGTLICVGGAMLLSLYHGAVVVGNSNIHWKYGHNMSAKTSSNKSKFFLGPLLLFASTAGWALWFVIKNNLSKKFPAPYTTTMLMSFMAIFECAAAAVISNHHATEWSLNNKIRLIASLCAGIVCSALTICIMSWVVDKKGPLYTSIFTPLLLVITAILSWALLQERLYVGMLLGSILIIGGLYSVLWGKYREIKQVATEGEIEPANEKDLELQADLK